jgi:hypothetical protein
VLSFGIHLKCVFLEDKPFLFGTWCHCEKYRGFGFLVGTLLSWELVISFFLPCFIGIDEIIIVEHECFVYLLCSFVFA